MRRVNYLHNGDRSCGEASCTTTKRPTLQELQWGLRKRPAANEAELLGKPIVPEVWESLLWRPNTTAIFAMYFISGLFSYEWYTFPKLDYPIATEKKCNTSFTNYSTSWCGSEVQAKRPKKETSKGKSYIVTASQIQYYRPNLSKIFYTNRTLQVIYLLIIY